MLKTLALPTSAAVLIGGGALADVPNVATDIAPVHSLVARVMEGVGTPALVIPAGASPHEYSLRPSEAEALQEADLVFWISEDLTPWMEDAVGTLAEGATVTSLLEADGIELLEFRESALFEAHSHDHGHDHGEDHAHGDEHGHDHDHGEEHAHGDDHGHDHDHDHGEDHAHGDDHGHDHEHDHGEDHAHGDDHGHDHDHNHGEEHAHGEDHGHDHAGHDHAHGTHDPHAWLSPDAAATWLNVIAGALSAADPENAGAYFQNAAAGQEEMEALKAEVSEMLAPVEGGRFIVFHDAYQYFERAFDFPASGAISLSDAAEPSPARIAEIQARIQEEGIDCVLAEPQFNPSLVETVLGGTEANTAVVDPIGVDLEPGPTLYPQLIRNMATTLAECL